MTVPHLISAYPIIQTILRAAVWI